MKKIGCIALGKMGCPTVERFLEDGYSGTVADISEKRVEKAKNLKAQLVHPPNELLNKVDILFTSLPSEKAVEEIYLGDKGLFNQKSETIMIDTSTVSPKLNNTLESKALEHNLKYLAAPVSG